MIERLRVRIPEGSAGEFSSPEFTLLCSVSFGVRSTPVLPQWHVKGHSHSAKSADGRVHLNTHTPWTQRSRSGLTRPLSRHCLGTYRETSSHATRQGTLNSSGNTRSQSSQLAELLLTYPGLKSGFSVRELISTLKKKERKKKESAGGE